MLLSIMPEAGQPVREPAHDAVMPKHDKTTYPYNDKGLERDVGNTIGKPFPNSQLVNIFAKGKGSSLVSALLFHLISIFT